MMTALLAVLSLTAAQAADLPKDLPKGFSAASWRVVSVAGGKLSADGKTLKAGDALAANRRIDLSEGSAVLSFGGAGKLLLKGPAIFFPAGSGARLKSGGLLSVLPHLGGAFRVEAGPIVAAVRGTDFFMERRGPATYVCLCHGALEVEGGRKWKDFHAALSSASAHSAAVFTAEGAVVTQRKADLEGHTDAEIAALLAP